MAAIVKLLALLAALRTWCAEHKKLTATILGGLVALVPQHILSDEQRNSLVGLLVAFVVGQGVADAGKEKAKIERRTPPPVPPQ
jgi:hypothetical protein